MKVIIAGSRNFADWELLKRSVDQFLSSTDGSPIEIVSGGANGADALGEKYANARRMKINRFHANWATYGKQAGYLRNKQMAQYADACICFWDGESKGTKLMIDLAEKHGLRLHVVKYQATAI